MADLAYNRGKQAFAEGDLDWTAHTIKVLLVTSAYAADADHNFVSDVVANEMTVAGYARVTLGSKTVTKDTATDKAVLDAADAAYASLTAGQTIGGAVVFREVTVDADSILVSFHDLTNTATAGVPVTVQWGANGVVTLS